MNWKDAFYTAGLVHLGINNKILIGLSIFVLFVVATITQAIIKEPVHVWEIVFAGYGLIILEHGVGEKLKKKKNENRLKN
jgi:hypothetical protein